LRTVTLNKCRDHFRRAARKSEPQFTDQLEIAIEDPTAVLTENEYQAFVARAALELMRDAFSESTWKACWESVVRGRPAREIAQELGTSVNSVYLARGRVLKRLRSELDGLWD
jgi:RNA polymerase sigma-70 factor (ECF subfamily)